MRCRIETLKKELVIKMFLISQILQSRINNNNNNSNNDDNNTIPRMQDVQEDF